jgi:pimeloyl-ACP methyl ester carboxylesterase
LLAQYQPDAARAKFLADPLAARLRREAPDNLASLLRFFDRPRPDVTASLLARIASDGPGISEAQIAAVAVPSLVIGTAMDHVHPLATAAALARLLPGSAFVEVAPKAADKALHLAEVRAAIGHFLRTLPSVC